MWSRGQCLAAITVARATPDTTVVARAVSTLEALSDAWAPMDEKQTCQGIVNTAACSISCGTAYLSRCIRRVCGRWARVSPTPWRGLVPSCRPSSPSCWCTRKQHAALLSEAAEGGQSAVASPVWMRTLCVLRCTVPRHRLSATVCCRATRQIEVPTLLPLPHRQIGQYLRYAADILTVRPVV